MTDDLQIENIQEIFKEDIDNIRPLGKFGGLSQLYIGRQKGLDVDVVIKKVKNNLKNKINEQKESKILVALRHQYLPRIYNFKVDKHQNAYIVMEYIAGDTLKEYVTKKGYLSQKETLKYIKQLCEAVDYMHTRKPKAFIHSDLKPENIIITTTGDICVIDFNTSLEEQENLRAIGLSAGFAAPEQYYVPLDKLSENSPLRKYSEIAVSNNWKNITCATDIYSIGCLAYYMLTGYTPAIWADGIIPLDRYNIVLGNAFLEVISKAMQPDIEKRFHSVKDMLYALNNLNKVDRRYKVWLRNVKLICFLLTTMFISGTLLVILGVNYNSKFLDNDYTSNIEKAVQLRNINDYQQAQNLLLQAIQEHPNKMQAYIELSVILYNQGEYQQVIDLLEGENVGDKSGDKQRLKQLQGQVFYLIANSYLQLNQYQKAVENMELSIWFLPDSLEYRRDLAICYVRNNQISAAKKELDTIKNKFPESIGDILLIEAELLFSQGDYVASIDKFNQAIKNLQDYSLLQRAYLEIVQVYENIGVDTIDQQINTLKTAISKLPPTYQNMCLEKLSVVYLNKANLDSDKYDYWLNEALNIINQTMNNGNKSFSVMLNKALVLQYLKNFEQAEIILNDMLNIYPNDYQIYKRLCFLYINEQFTLDVSVRDYTKALQAYKTAYDIYKNIGIEDIEMQQLEQTISKLER